MIDGVQLGDTISCTLKKAPRAQGASKTIRRLMQRDPDATRALDRAQHLRRKRMHTYIRGNRVWHSREKCSSVVQVRDGESWTMRYTPDIVADLDSVASYLSVSKA